MVVSSHTLLFRILFLRFRLKFLWQVTDVKLLPSPWHLDPESWVVSVFLRIHAQRQIWVRPVPPHILRNFDCEALNEPLVEVDDGVFVGTIKDVVEGYIPCVGVPGLQLCNCLVALLKVSG